MPIKRIQLRGISRTPSDHMTADGGCADSINVRVNENEQCPAIMPRDVSDDKLSNANIPMKVIYSYSPFGTDWFIGIGSNNLYFLKNDCTDPQTFALSSGETVIKISTIGNTVIVLTNQRTRYYYYKGSESTGTYSYLGEAIPKPTVQFRNYNYEVNQEIIDDSLLLSSSETTAWRKMIITNGALNATTYNELMTHYGTSWPVASGDSATVTETEGAVVNAVWRKINERRLDRRNNNKFSRPVMAVYAVRLYDGSYVNVSQPVLVGANAFNFSMNLKYLTTGGVNKFSIFNCNEYSLSRTITCDSEQFSNWTDIVKSIDIFLSTDIAYPSDNCIFTTAAIEATASTVMDFYPRYERTLLEEILTKDTFYRVESYELQTGTNTAAVVPISQDDLVVKPKLDYDFRSGNNACPLNNLSCYNGRIVGVGMRETLAIGYSFPQTPRDLWSSETATYSNYVYVYYIKGDDGVDHIVSTTENMMVSVSDYLPLAFIMYPDTRCYKCEVYATNDLWLTIKKGVFEMTAHPTLECAYYFEGNLGRPLQELITTVVQSVPSESRAMTYDTKLIMSKVDNPFVYPLENRATFGSKIMDVASTTVALATGQYDAASLYVFTEDGIEAERLNSLGTFVSHDHVSRDVAFEGTVCPIDNAIVFSSKRGVMLLQNGNQIVCLSDNMNGKPYYMEGVDSDSALTDARKVIHDNDTANTWRKLGVDTITSIDNFTTYLSGAKYLFDYAGRRLFVCREGYDYSYVYNFESQTWHRIYPDPSKYSTSVARFSCAINSYPETYACFYCGTEASGTIVYKVMDLSTFYSDSVASSDAVYGIIVTRGQSLDATDSRKRINDVMIRGKFERENVKYILMGSMDGITYKVLPSLRGVSCKFFRFIILTKLKPNERISWIDVEYDVVMDNKLR